MHTMHCYKTKYISEDGTEIQNDAYKAVLTEKNCVICYENIHTA